MILVTGGRGRIARATVARLRAAGRHVRVASRCPAEIDLAGVEIAAADIARTSDWAPLLDGVTGVLLYADPAGVEAFVQAARPTGAQIALVSAAGIDGAAEDDPIARMHRAAEAAVRASGLPWTFLRVGGLASNALQWAASIRSGGVVRAPYPGSHAALVHEADVADVAALVLTVPGHEEEVYEITGPASLTQEEQVRHIAEAAGVDVRFEEIAPEEYRRTLGQWGDNSVVDSLMKHLRGADGRPQPLSPAYRELTGRSGRTFRQWAVDHADAFRPAAPSSPPPESA
jgi:uncharacterized protein YbjT (DUF2867 family)